MIYTARAIDRAAQPTLAFSQRKITGLTQSRIGDLELHAVPDQTQIAYSGYKDNICAFTHATAMKKKVTTNQQHYPLPMSFQPEVPLPLPKVIAALSKRPDAEGMEKLTLKFEKIGGYQVTSGARAQNPFFTVDKPTFRALQSVLPSLCSAQGPRMEGYAQLGAAKAILPVYQFIELFLAVNSYEYKGEEQTEVNEKGETLYGEMDEVMEMRAEAVWYREGWSEGSLKKQKTLGDKWQPMAIDAHEVSDLTHKKPYNVRVHDLVPVAKPSFRKASDNWGRPSAVPFKKGIFFPYFANMVAPDSAGLRRLILNLCIKNLGSDEISPYHAYKGLKEDLGTVANTEEGCILEHVLKGIDLTLQSQTLLYLVCDEGLYHGFVLLGAHFKVYAQGRWHEPLEAFELRQELDRVRTVDASFLEMVESIRSCRITDTLENVPLTEEAAKIRANVASSLAMIDVKAADQKEKVQRVSDAVSAVYANTTYRTLKKGFIEEALQILVSPTVDKSNLPPFYIPVDSNKWIDIGEKNYWALAAFGPRSFSFRTAKGDNFRVPKTSTDKEHFNFEQKHVEGKQSRLILYEKVVSECVKDWSAVVETGCLQMTSERAAGQRSHVFTGDHAQAVYSVLKVAAAEGAIGIGKGAEKNKEADFAKGFGYGGGDYDAIEF